MNGMTFHLIEDIDDKINSYVNDGCIPVDYFKFEDGHIGIGMSLDNNGIPIGGVEYLFTHNESNSYFGIAINDRDSKFGDIYIGFDCTNMNPPVIETGVYPPSRYDCDDIPIGWEIMDEIEEGDLPF